MSPQRALLYEKFEPNNLWFNKLSGSYGLTTLSRCLRRRTVAPFIDCPVPINNLNLRIKTEPVTVKFEPFSPRALRNKDLSSSQNVFKLKCAVNKSCLKASLFKAGLLCEKYNLFARTTYWHSFGFCKLMFRSIKIK